MIVLFLGYSPAPLEPKLQLFEVLEMMVRQIIIASIAMDSGYLSGVGQVNILSFSTYTTTREVKNNTSSLAANSSYNTCLIKPNIELLWSALCTQNKALDDLKLKRIWCAAGSKHIMFGFPTD